MAARQIHLNPFEVRTISVPAPQDAHRRALAPKALQFVLISPESLKVLSARDNCGFLRTSRHAERPTKLSHGGRVQGTAPEEHFPRPTCLQSGRETTPVL
eukprot:scaffold340_cov256-Pinguiococcus_pyrenoidosus.AAC.12